MKSKPSIYWDEAVPVSFGGTTLIVADACDHAAPKAFDAWVGERIQFGGKTWHVISVVLFPYPFVLQGMPVGLNVIPVGG